LKVLVVGSGGREHALVWKISQSPELTELHVAPGSAAMAELAECHPETKATDLAGILALSQREAIDLVVVGPEDPLADGLSDRLREAGIATFGPSAAAAQLEGSKAFAKDFMQRHEIPTAAYAVFDAKDAAHDYVDALARPCVVKADGLAAGKGVAMCEDAAAAHVAIDEMMAPRIISARSMGTKARTRAEWAHIPLHRSSVKRSRRRFSSASSIRRFRAWPRKAIPIRVFST